MGEFVDYLSSFNKELITVLQQFWVLVVLIALISCFFTQAIKKTDTEVFTKKNLSPLHYWIINLGFSLMTSIFVIIVFDGIDSVGKTILYICLNWICGWTLSVIGYDYVLKYLFKTFEIGELKLDTIICSMTLENNRMNSLTNKKVFEKVLAEQVDKEETVK